jgi:hypothetical protein
MFNNFKNKVISVLSETVRFDFPCKIEAFGASHQLFQDLNELVAPYHDAIRSFNPKNKEEVEELSQLKLNLDEINGFLEKAKVLERELSIKEIQDLQDYYENKGEVFLLTLSHRGKETTFFFEPEILGKQVSAGILGIISQYYSDKHKVEVFIHNHARKLHREIMKLDLPDFFQMHTFTSRGEGSDKSVMDDFPHTSFLAISDLGVSVFDATKKGSFSRDRAIQEWIEHMLNAWLPKHLSNDLSSVLSQALQTDDKQIAVSFLQSMDKSGLTEVSLARLDHIQNELDQFLANFKIKDILRQDLFLLDVPMQFREERFSSSPPFVSSSQIPEGMLASTPRELKEWMYRR